MTAPTGKFVLATACAFPQDNAGAKKDLRGRPVVMNALAVLVDNHVVGTGSAGVMVAANATMGTTATKKALAAWQIVARDAFMAAAKYPALVCVSRALRVFIAIWLSGATMTPSRVTISRLRTTSVTPLASTASAATSCVKLEGIALVQANMLKIRTLGVILSAALPRVQKQTPASTGVDSYVQGTFVGTACVIPNATMLIANLTLAIV